jgi:hypothetical protein
MAPLTHTICYKTMPINQSEAGEADNIKKSKFFDTYDDREEGESVASVAYQKGTTLPTANRWL